MLSVLLTAACTTKSSPSSEADFDRVLRTTTTQPGAAPPQSQTAFESGDALLRGEIFGSGKGQAALLVHAPTADMRSLFPLAQRLAAAGLTAMTFDLQGYGRSEGAKDPSTHAQDIGAALAFLDNRGNAPVAIVAVEGAGTASVIAAADLVDVNALALVGSGPTFAALDATEAARKIQADTVIFSSGTDGGEQLGELIPGADVRRSPQRRNPASDTQLQSELVSFVADALGVSAP